MGRCGVRSLGHVLLIALLTLGFAAGCDGAADNVVNPDDGSAAEPLVLPTVAAMVQDGDRIRVLATTSIIGHVVEQVGGEAIDLAVLMQPGQDPHSYQPGAADLAAAADADVIFVNGWDLEEALAGDLAAIGSEAAFVPISAGIEPLELVERATDHDEEQAEEEHTHGPVDPHTWQNVANVIQWVENVRQVLAAADPANAATFDANAAAYRATLEQLDADIRETLADIPADRRVLITNHDNLGYFAAAYGFEVAGTVIPSASTLAEPTAGALAELVEVMNEKGVCILFIETTAADQLARALADELTGCTDVQILTLYTDALGPAGGEADSYTGMMRANATTLANGLK